MAMTSGPARLWKAARGLPDRTPLRVKLISALLALVAIALAVISLAGISFLRSYLLGQADEKLQQLADQLQFQSFQTSVPQPYQLGEAVIWVPDGGDAQQIVTPISVSEIGSRSRQHVIAGPAYPASPGQLPSSAKDAITVAATGGGGRWRVVGLPASAPNSDGSRTDGTVVLGIDVSSAYNTIGRLTAIDLVVSAIVILALAIVGIALVRASLRPLTEIERTAEGIAAGDLTRRVPDHDPRTEVGRLGRSLNAMLSQIEVAFRARSESEEAARGSEQRMRQFVADASHELRTPLTTIRGFAEYYRQRDGVDDGWLNGGSESGQLTRIDLDRIMRRVEQESTRMGVLVEDMLMLARLDQQRPLESRPVDLLTLAADAVHDARVMAPGRSIDLTVGAGAAMIVIGDETRLRQVIGNLMSNALVHTPDGTPVQVRIRSGFLDETAPGAGPAAVPAPAAVPPPPAAAVPAPAAVPPPPAGPPPAAVPAPAASMAAAALPAVVLEVADQGPGLTPDQAERAFERFYRADQARTRQAGGTGLGLAIVAALVTAHGGTVRVDTSPGSGATFRIALPMAPEARGHTAS
jgi:two-component system OmpR family sensor kinase